ncbi:PREDICTED: uncharacterized protein LOC109241915 [Nicotiana attenuata]|uniref:uncharacterized protein LOC109241915 n=1 Tax=Nicotiana attenuata TaxID=49451 RepID=UPI000904BF47|nr:PREDICTED: uncharacterized protein LOC109241915 [Nicotiana attenuata]
MDVIRPIEPDASKRHRFVLVVIDYFTKWVEAASYKAVTTKVVADFIRYRIICRFGVPESIISDNSTNIDSDMMKSMFCTSTGTTLYLLVYGTEAVIPAEVEIPSLRIIQEAELNDVEWVQSRYEKLALINGKRTNVVCYNQLYQNRMARDFNKKVRSRQLGKLVLKRIFPY